MLELESVCKSYGGRIVIRNLSLTIRDGTITFLIGPNGAGKTTLFKLITGTESLDSGSICFLGNRIDNELPHVRRRLGLSHAFQTPSSIPELTVQSHLELASGISFRALPSMLRAKYPKSLHLVIHRLLSNLGLEKMDSLRPSDLSHGQLKLLEIATSIVRCPQVLLLDEPTAGLTRKEGLVVADLVRRLKEHSAIIIIEHDMEFVREIGEHVVVLHEGNVFRSGSYEELRADVTMREIYFGILE